MKTLSIAVLLVCLNACGCLTARVPVASDKPFDTYSVNLDEPKSAWALENFSPAANIPLSHGMSIPFSVELKIHGEGSYVLEFENDKGKQYPFVLQAVEHNGSVEFSGKITWFSGVCGRHEQIKISLYRVEKSDFGKSTSKTLIKELGRNYDVICDDNDFFLFLAFKKLFGICTRK